MVNFDICRIYTEGTGIPSHYYENRDGHVNWHGDSDPSFTSHSPLLAALPARTVPESRLRLCDHDLFSDNAGVLMSSVLWLASVLLDGSGQK